MAKKREQAQVDVIVNGKQPNASIRDLEVAANKLRREIRGLNTDTKEFAQKEKELKKITGRLREIKTGAQATSKAMKTLKTLLSFGGITAAITAVIGVFKKFITNSAEFNKSLSSLSAITGLVGKDLQFMAKEAKKTSKQTLQSANDIVKAYELVGSIRPELLKNKELLAEVTKSAIILSEATGGKLLLEDAAQATAGTLNQFNYASSRSVEVINILAAGSKEGAANIVNISTAIEQFGAVASGANVTLEQSVGLIETLAEKNILGAEAGTKLRNVILILQQDQKNYKNGVFDLNKALDNLSKRSNDNIALFNEFGKQNVVAAKIIAENTDKFRKYTEAVTGTNVALEQQAIQNDNLASNWKKLINRINNAITSNAAEGFLNRMVKSLLKALDGTRIFKEKLINYYNDIIKGNATIRTIVTIVGEAVKLNFKGMAQSALLFLEPLKGIAKLLKAIATGDFKNLDDIIKETLSNIKGRMIDIGNNFVDSGKKIAEAFKGENIDQFLISTKETEEEINNLNNSMQQLASNNKEVFADWSDNIKKLTSDLKDSMESEMKDYFNILDNYYKDDTKNAIKYADQKLKDFLNKEEEKRKAVEENFKKTLKISEEIGNATGELFGDILTGNEEAMKDSAKNLLKIILKSVKVSVQGAIAQAAALSFAQPDSVASFGATGIIRSGILTGLIEAAFAVFEKAISNAKFYYGGHTGPGSPTEPAGIVHKNEYVVSEPMLHDPVIYDFIRNYAEPYRLSINPKALSAAGIGNGFAQGGSTSPGTIQTPQYSADTNRQLEENNKLMKGVQNLLYDLKIKGVKINWDQNDTYQIRHNITDQQNIESDASR